MPTHTQKRSPLHIVSCRSRPDCPFRCNLICTPIILCFSGGSVSRAPSQHVDLLLPSISHCLSVTFTSSPICVSSEKHRTYTHAWYLSLHPSCRTCRVDVSPIGAHSFSSSLPFWKIKQKMTLDGGIDYDVSIIPILQIIFIFVGFGAFISFQRDLMCESFCSTTDQAAEIVGKVYLLGFGAIKSKSELGNHTAKCKMHIHQFI